VKENEPKENARVTRLCGLPCASRSGRTPWNSLRSNSQSATRSNYGRPLLRCSARHKGEYLKPIRLPCL